MPTVSCVGWIGVMNPNVGLNSMVSQKEGTQKSKEQLMAFVDSGAADDCRKGSELSIPWRRRQDRAVVWV